MSITIDDKAAIIFEIYDELTQTYTKEIDGYKTLIKAVSGMIDQKEKDIQSLKDKVIDLMKQSFSTSPEAEVPAEEAIVETIIDAQPSETARTEPVKEEKAETPKKKKPVTQKTSKASPRSKKTAAEKSGKKGSKPKPSPPPKTEEPAATENPVMCLHHPDAPAADIGKQLCSSCKWKIRANGLMGHDKDPQVIAFLKGETTVAPLIGQPMCPIHPNTPAYNKKTGLCARCQSKARGIGISDRPLTDQELILLQNPSL